MKLTKIISIFDTNSIPNDAREFYEFIGKQLEKVPSGYVPIIELSAANESDGNLFMYYERAETDEEEQERIKQNEKNTKRNLVEEQTKINNELKRRAKWNSIYETT